MELLTSSAMKCGFTGGLVVDYPNSTKAKKYFLVLMTGIPEEGYKLPKAKGLDDNEQINDDDQESAQVNYSTNRRRNHEKKKK
jgi:18S rRNA (guanine1575-N7)-methyltransferase